MMKLFLLCLPVGISCQFLGAAQPAARPTLPANVEHALAAITAAELRGDLSFLASDALQGRYTPSPGLEVAAEFIASKFRAAGLEPGGNDGYFQTAEMIEQRPATMASGLTIQVGDRKVEVPASAARVETTSQAAHLERVPVVFLSTKDPAVLSGLDVRGKAVIAAEGDGTERRKARAFDQAVSAAGALLNVTVLRIPRVTATQPRLLFADQVAEARTPSLSVVNEELAGLIAAGAKEAATVSVDIPAPLERRVVVKNVVAILRGSDPALAKTAVLLTAHYDHIGTTETAGQTAMHSNGDSNDRIYNGANDDGSGTVSVIEIAGALAKLRPRPRRSIVFMTFFGEERGELGSRFYGKHPIFPIAQTVADVNLEQMGRTDSTIGSQLNNASVTGFDYSDVTGYLQWAGEQVGIKVYRDAEASDAYFTRSDNDALAEQGVPAHTICVAFDYPDYHGLGDEWPKVNYENMAKVDRMVALAVVNLANSRKAPEWNAGNPKTEHFRAARVAATTATK